MDEKKEVLRESSSPEIRGVAAAVRGRDTNTLEYGVYRSVNIRNDGTIKPALQTTASARLRFRGRSIAARRVSEPGPDDCVGHGAFGQVFAGFLDGHRRVAMKELDPKKCLVDGMSAEEMEQCFFYECARNSTVSHPHIVEFHGVAVKGSRRFMVFDYCKGGTLTSALSRHGVPSLCNQWRLLVQIASGIRYLHAQGMLHRDLKSENILLSVEDWDVSLAYLADLGVAQVDALLRTDAEIQAVSSGVKDRWWSSPEEARNETVTAKSDVFAFGLVAYHVTTGREPFHQYFAEENGGLGRMLERVRGNQVLEDLRLPKDLPFANLLRRCFMDHPDDRPTAAEVEQELLALAPVCFENRVLAAQSVKTHVVSLALHTSRHERQGVVPVAVTHQPGLTAVPDDFEFEFQRQERVHTAEQEIKEVGKPESNDKSSLTAEERSAHSRSDDDQPVTPDDSDVEEQKEEEEEEEEERKGAPVALGPLPTVLELGVLVDRFLQEPGARVLVVVGEGGAGKSLLLQQIAIQHTHAFPLRLVLPPDQWTRSHMRGVIYRALSKGLGLADGVIEAMRTRPHVFLVDALDELTVDEDWDADQATLLERMGLSEWPRSKVILTSRRGTLNESGASMLLGSGTHVWMQYVLPFNQAQIRHYLRRADAVDAPSLPWKLLANPLVLRLYASCDSTLLPHAPSRNDVYAAVLRKWCAGLAATLPQSLLRALCEGFSAPRTPASVLMNDGDAASTTIAEVKDSSDPPELASLLRSFERMAGLYAIDMFLTGAISVDREPSPTSYLPQDSARHVWLSLKQQVQDVAREIFKAHAREAESASSSVRLLVSEPDYITLQWRQVTQVLQTCPLKPASINTFTFVHKSFQDYLMARFIATQLSGSGRPSNSIAGQTHIPTGSLALSQRLLSADPIVLRCVAEQVKGDRRAIWRELVQHTLEELDPARRLAHLILPPQLERWAALPVRIAAATAVAFTFRQGRMHALRLLSQQAQSQPVPVRRRTHAAQQQQQQGNDDDHGYVDHLSRRLIQLVLEARHTKPLALPIRIAAANAISILNVAGVSFSGVDLSDVQLGFTPEELQQQKVTFGADLGGFVAHRTILQNASLCGAVIQQAMLNDAILDGADLREVKLGQLPMMLGHTHGVNALVMSADGQTMYSASDDTTIRQWDLTQGECTRIFKGHDSEVVVLGLSPHGHFLFSASHDRAVRVWNLASGQCVRVFEGHTSDINALGVSHDGRTLYSASLDHTVRQWDLVHDHVQSVAVDFGYAVTALLVTADAVFAASFFKDSTGDKQHFKVDADMPDIQQWDLSEKKCIRSMRGHTSAITALAAPASGRILFSASHDSTIRQWNVMESLCTRVLTGHSSHVVALALSEDGNTLYSGSSDSTVRQWDLTQGRCTHVMEGHFVRVNAVVLSTDGRTLLSGSGDGTIRQWNLDQPQCTRVSEGHSGDVKALVISANKRILYSGSSDCSIRQWNLDQPNQFARSLEGHTGGVNVLALSMDGHTLYSGSDDHSIRQWSVDDCRCTDVLQGHVAPVTALALSADGRTLYSGSGDLSVRQWDLVHGHCTLTRTLMGHTFEITALVLSADEGILYSCAASIDEYLQWRTSDGTKIDAVLTPQEKSLPDHQKRDHAQLRMWRCRSDKKEARRILLEQCDVTLPQVIVWRSGPQRLSATGLRMERVMCSSAVKLLLRQTEREDERMRQREREWESVRVFEQLCDLPFLMHLPRQERRNFARSITGKREYKRGDVIIHSGTVPQKALYITHGMVAVHYGQQVHVLTAGHVLALYTVLTQTRYVPTVEALGSVEVHELPSELLQHYQALFVDHVIDRLELASLCQRSSYVQLDTSGPHTFEFRGTALLLTGSARWFAFDSGSTGVPVSMVDKPNNLNDTVIQNLPVATAPGALQAQAQAQAQLQAQMHAQAQAQVQLQVQAQAEVGAEEQALSVHGVVDHTNSPVSDVSDESVADSKASEHDAEDDASKTLWAPCILHDNDFEFSAGARLLIFWERDYAKMFPYVQQQHGVPDVGGPRRRAHSE